MAISKIRRITVQTAEMTGIRLRMTLRQAQDRDG